MATVTFIHKKGGKDTPSYTVVLDIKCHDNANFYGEEGGVYPKSEYKPINENDINNMPPCQTQKTP